MRKNLAARLFLIPLAAVVLPLVLAVPADASTRGAWIQFGYSPTKSGFNSAERALTPGSAGRLVERWATPMSASPGDEPVYATPVVSGGRVFAMGFYGKLVALRASDGATLWTVNMGMMAGRNTPALVGRLVIAAAGQWDKGGVVAAFAALTGRRVWSTSLPDPIAEAVPTYYGGKIFVGGGHKVYALSASSGRLLWSTAVTSGEYNEIGGPVALSAGGTFALAACTNGTVAALRVSNGQIVWSRQIGGGVYHGGVAVSSGIGYVASGTQGSEGGGFLLHAFRVSDGKELWSRPAGDDVHITPTVGAGIVTIGSIDGRTFAYNAVSGARRWVSSVGGEVWSQAALASGVLYAGTEYGIVTLNARTGARLAAINWGAGWANMSSVAVAGGRVYIGSGEGIVRMLAP